MSSICWICIFLVHIVNLTKSFTPSGAIKIESEENFATVKGENLEETIDKQMGSETVA
jgi:hypothetical protein